MTIRTVGDRFILDGTPPREGGTARVFRARDHDTNRIVAVKVLEIQGAEGGLIREIFLRETEALASLKHPNVVELIASGFDDTLNRFFIVLEWVELGLIDHWDSLPAEEQGWDTLASFVLKPVLSGLALAHSRDILHRDIKPSNILVANDGTPKLADFGIAKLIRSLRIGVTVGDFATVPFAPPEHGRLAPTPSGDLFSLGMTCLACLLPREFELTHENINEAIREADLPNEGEEFIRRLVATDLESRPQSGQTALIELERIREARPHHLSPRQFVHLHLPGGVANDLARLLGCPNRAAVETAILKDLSDGAAIGRYERPDQKPDPSGQETYILVGQEFSYHVALEKDSGQSALVVLKALNLPPSLLESRRENSLALDAQFTFARPASRDLAHSSLLAMLEDVAEFVQEQKLRERTREEKRLFRQWENILLAQTALEKSREKPIRYTWFELQGKHIVFTIENESEDDLIGQARCAPSGSNATVCGVVDDLVANKLSLYVTVGNTSKLPQRGLVVIDTHASQTAINRQRRALDLAQYGRAHRSDLGDLLVHPNQCRPPTLVEDIVPIQNDVDPPKLRALSAALGAEDIFVVQGPPGTGKTTWIAELICQYLKRNPSKKVLISAQTHIAVDNALSRIRGLNPTLRVIRVGPAEKIAEEVESLQVSEQVLIWGREVRQKSYEFLTTWAKAHGIADESLSLTLDLDALDSADRREGDLVTQVKDLEEQLGISHADSQESTAELTDPSQRQSETDAKRQELEAALAEARESLDKARAEIRSLRSRIASVLEDPALDRAGVRRLRDAVSERLGSAAAGTTALAKLYGLQQEWVRRFGHGPEFEKALLSVADVVGGTCLGIAAAGPAAEVDFDLVVIDEASKATPTEALVAMTRGRSWVLVGDQRQLPPFVDTALLIQGFAEKYDLTREELEETLFDRLTSQLSQVCQATLTVQHRMVPAVGDLISECFYEGKLESARSEFEGSYLSSVLRKPVTWYSTSRLARRREMPSPRSEGGQSFKNLEEATRIREWLEKLEQLAQRTMRVMSVGVITGYSAQKDHLRRELTPADRLLWQALRLEVNSVDAFQGRECDVLVYSVTRSNDRGELGFLVSQARLNVALSRGRDALVIFGDALHCVTSGDLDNPFRGVIRYIEDHPKTCEIVELK